MRGLEGLIGLIWLMIFVGSILRSVIQGKQRAQREAVKRAARRARGLQGLDSRPPGRAGQLRRPAPGQGLPDLGKQVFRTGWPIYPGQPAQPVVVTEPDMSAEEAESAEEVSVEGASVEGNDRDIRHRLRQERSEEWESERVRTWQIPAGAGSLGNGGEAFDGFAIRRGETLAADTDLDALGWALDDEMDPGDVGAALAAEGVEGDTVGRQLRTGIGPGHALAGIVWGTVLGPPRCRSQATMRMSPHWGADLSEKTSSS